MLAKTLIRKGNPMQEISSAQKKQFILDTNVLIHDPSALFNFKEHDVVVPMTVLEELDHIKDSQKGNHLQVSREARLAIQHIDKVVNGHSPEQLRVGIPIGEGLGMLRVVMELNRHDASVINLPDIDVSIPDNRIIMASLFLTKTTANTQTVLVTKDINMRLKAKAAGVMYVEDYRTDQVLSDIDYLSPGFIQLEESPFLGEVSSTASGRSYSISVDKTELHPIVLSNLYPNFAFIYDDDVWFVDKVDTQSASFLCAKTDSLMRLKAFGVAPRNIEQALAMRAALSESVDILFLTGPAGTGKTLIALASALELVIEQGCYDKIIVTRSVTEMDEPIGFLPGTEEEKMKPWLAAFSDSLEVLTQGMAGGGQDKPAGAEALAMTLSLLQKKANLQFKALTFMRGRSINNAVIILDESQNLTPHQMRSMITRVGAGSKIICLGNLQQIDSRYLTALTSGLTVAVERFKPFEKGATVMLKGGVRSDVASFAEDVF